MTWVWKVLGGVIAAVLVVMAWPNISAALAPSGSLSVAEARGQLDRIAQGAPGDIFCDAERRAEFRRAARAYSFAMRRTGVRWPDPYDFDQEPGYAESLVMAGQITQFMSPLDLADPSVNWKEFQVIDDMGVLLYSREEAVGACRENVNYWHARGELEMSKRRWHRYLEAVETGDAPPEEPRTERARGGYARMIRAKDAYFERLRAIRAEHGDASQGRVIRLSP